MRVLICCLAFAAACIWPEFASAQETEQRADSLEREVTELRERLDSLEQILRRLVGRGEDTLEVIDELAALRAAARSVVPEQTADTAPTRFVMRSRNLNDLNPELTVTGDLRLNATRPGPQENNADIREFQVGVQSTLDPYSLAKIYFSLTDSEVLLEEAYLYWTGLPGGVRLDFGRFRQQVGQLNRLHLHGAPESEYPLVISEYFGSAGLVGNGLGAYWTAPVQSPGGGVHEVWGQATLGENETLFEGSSRLSFLGHVNNFWQLSRSTYFQLGATGVYGANPDADIKTSVFGGDFRLTWRPPETSLYRSFTLRGEGYAVRRQIAGVGDRRYGGFIGAVYQATRRVHVGARVDYVERLDTAPGEHIWSFVPNFTFWQSEWVLLRAEWQHLSVPLLATGRDTSDKFVLQVIWSIGPHKHESY